MQIENSTRSLALTDKGSMPVSAGPLPIIPVPVFFPHSTRYSLSGQTSISRTTAAGGSSTASSTSEQASTSTHSFSKPVRHPFSPYYQKSAGSKTNAGKKSISRLRGEYEFREEEDEDEWFCRPISSTDVKDIDSTSLLLFRERQRRYYWVKQVRERERLRLEAAQEEKRVAAKRKLDEEEEKQDGKKQRMDGTKTYSRTLYLRSPSPDSMFWGVGKSSRESTPVRGDPEQAPPGSTSAKKGNSVEWKSSATAPPVIQVNGATVVKVTGTATAAGGRPRGLWRGKGSGPAAPAKPQQIGGFVFGSGFLAARPQGPVSSRKIQGSCRRSPSMDSCSSASENDPVCMLPVQSLSVARGGGEFSNPPCCFRSAESGLATPLRTSTPTVSPPPSNADIQHKRKQDLDGPAHTQRKRQRTALASAPLLSELPPEFSAEPKAKPLAMSSDEHSKYVMRSKVMDTSSLAWCNPSVLESRGAASVPQPEYAYDEHGQLKIQKEPDVTLEDWEDLKEVWMKCLEAIDVEEPAEMLPLLRAVVHECTRFLKAFEDPSVIFLKPRQPKPASTSSTPVGIGVGTADSGRDVAMLPSIAPTSPPIPPQTAYASSSSSSTSIIAQSPHHDLCRRHNLNRTGGVDLPTAFHSLLGTALFYFGNFIGENPELALEGEPRTATMYHLYALDVFEVGENIPAKTLIGSSPQARKTTTTSTPSYTGSYHSSSDSTDSMSVAGPAADCCGFGMKEDWHMAVTWGRTLVSLAENLLERQRVVEEPGQTFEAAFLLEDFRVLGLAKGGYFEGTGGLGLSLNGIGQLVPTAKMTAFYPPSASPSFSSSTRRSAADDFLGSRPASSSSTSSSPSSANSGNVATTPISHSRAASFLSPSFIAASTGAAHSAAASASTASTYVSPSTRSTSSSSSSSSSSATYTGATPTAISGVEHHNPYYANENDPRRFWRVDSPFVVIRSRIPPVTRRMSLGTGGGVSVDDMMTLAVDQFSRGIFHMPRSGPTGAAAGDDIHGHQHQQQHHHRGHKRLREREGQDSLHVNNAVPSFFSRASHLNTIATQVLHLAELLDAPESRQKWGRYADSVFEQMRLEENPGAAVVMFVNESFSGALNDDVDVDEDEEEMDVDEDEVEVEEHRRRQAKHKHRHGHKHRHASGAGEVTVVRPPTNHPDLFLNNNTNPEVLKARGRCSLVIGAAMVEEGLLGPLEEAYNRQSDGDEGIASGSVKQILESEDAVEVRERLEEAVKHLEKARDVWRREVWGPRHRVRESARRRKTREATLQSEKAQREERLRMQKRKQENGDEVVEKPAKAKRRGIGRIAADNKRSAKTSASPPRLGSPSPKGKARASIGSPPKSMLNFGSAVNTPVFEKEAEAAMLFSPGAEIPPPSPAASEIGVQGYFPLASVHGSEEQEEDDDEEEEDAFRAEEEEEMEEQDLAQLLAQALYMLGDLALGKEEKEAMYSRAKEETSRAGKAELVEEDERMNVD